MGGLQCSWSYESYQFGVMANWITKHAFGRLRGDRRQWSHVRPDPCFSTEEKMRQGMSD